MDWETIKSKLEHILDKPLRMSSQSTDAERFDQDVSLLPSETQYVQRDGEIHFLLDYHEGSVDVLIADAAHLTDSEKQLIQMMLEAYRVQNGGYAGQSREEREVELLRNWLQTELEQGSVDKELPALFAGQASLFTGKVPLLLYGEYFDNKKVNYQELKRLLESFFDAETILIPIMDREWLILCPESLFFDDDKGIIEEESIEDGLASICLGLYGMMVSEGIGECHLSIHYPIVPAKDLLATVIRLREAIKLGRLYHVSSNIHLPWALQLESIVNHLPDAEKRRMITSILKSESIKIDTETLLTLEAFFEQDGNMSETSKKLYIHRNTLSYRLDRFKQETGLDVRSFNDGIMAKIGLLLYKVTKRS